MFFQIILFSCLLQGFAHPLINNVIENDYDQNMVEAAEPIARDLSNVELEAAASYDHYGGHYKQPDEYHHSHSQQEYHQPHTQSQSYSHSEKHSSSEDHDHHR